MTPRTPPRFRLARRAVGDLAEERTPGREPPERGRERDRQSTAEDKYGRGREVGDREGEGRVIRGGVSTVSQGFSA